MAAPQASSRLEMLQARFQQKQLQEKEQKLLQLYDQQQQRAYQVVQRGSAGSNHGSTSTVRTTPTTHTTSTSQGGKVRQMFDERRQTTVKGIDRSYPLEPLENKLRKQTNANGVTGAQRNGNSTVNRQSVSMKRMARADVNSNVNGGKPVVSYHEEITRDSFGPFTRRHDEEDEFGIENRIATFANGHHRHDIDNEQDEALDQEAMERNRMMAKIHLMGFDETLKHRVRNDLESEEFPEYLMADVPEKLPKKNITKKLSQAQARLDRFKNTIAKKNSAPKQPISSGTVIKKRSEQMEPARSNSQRNEIAATSPTSMRSGSRTSERSQRILANVKTPLPAETRVVDGISKRRGKSSDVDRFSRKDPSWKIFLGKVTKTRTYPRNNEFKSLTSDGKIFIRRSPSPQFLCTESERSGTTMSIDRKSTDSRLASPDRMKRGTSPQFCRENERSAITMSIDRKTDGSKSSEWESEVYGKRSISPRYFDVVSRQNPRTTSITSSTKSPEWDMRSSSKGSASPQFFSRESERSATAMSIDGSAKSGTIPQYSSKQYERSETSTSIDRKSNLSESPLFYREASTKRSANPHFFLDEFQQSRRTDKSNSPIWSKEILQRNMNPRYFREFKQTEKNIDTDRKTSEFESLKWNKEMLAKQNMQYFDKKHGQSTIFGQKTTLTKSPLYEKDILKRRSTSPQFFCKESERSGTTMTIDRARSESRSPLYVRKIVTKRSSSPQFFCKESERSGTTMAIDRARSESRSPLYDREIVTKRSSSPQFFCKESERSGTTMAIDRARSESRLPLYDREIVTKRSSSPQFFCKESERSGTTMAIDRARSESRSPLYDRKIVTKRSSSPQFFCKESERSATTMSIDRKVNQPKSLSYNQKILTKQSKSPEYFNRKSGQHQYKMTTDISQEYDKAKSTGTTRDKRTTSPQFFCKETEKSATTMLIEPRSSTMDSAKGLKQRNYSNISYKQSTKSVPSVNKKMSSTQSRYISKPLIANREIKRDLKKNEISVTESRRSSKISESSATSASSIVNLKYGLEFDNIFQSAKLVGKFMKSQKGEQRQVRQSPPKRNIKNVSAPTTKDIQSRNRYKTSLLSQKTRSPSKSEIADQRRTTPESPRKSITPTEVDMEIQEITMTDHRIERDRLQNAASPISNRQKRQIDRIFAKSPNNKMKFKTSITYPVRKTYRQRASILGSSVLRKENSFGESKRTKDHRSDRDSEGSAISLSKLNCSPVSETSHVIIRSKENRVRKSDAKTREQTWDQSIKNRTECIGVRPKRYEDRQRVSSRFPNQMRRRSTEDRLQSSKITSSEFLRREQHSTVSPILCEDQKARGTRAEFEQSRRLQSMRLVQDALKDKDLSSSTIDTHDRQESKDKQENRGVDEVDVGIDAKYQTIVETVLNKKMKNRRKIVGPNSADIRNKDIFARKGTRVLTKSITQKKQISPRRECGRQHDIKSSASSRPLSSRQSPKMSPNISQISVSQRIVLKTDRSSSPKFLTYTVKDGKRESVLDTKETADKIRDKMNVKRVIKKSDSTAKEVSKALMQREDKSDFGRTDSVESALKRFDSIGAEFEHSGPSSFRASPEISLQAMNVQVEISAKRPITSQESTTVDSREVTGGTISKSASKRAIDKDLKNVARKNDLKILGKEIYSSKKIYSSKGLAETERLTRSKQRSTQTRSPACKRQLFRSNIEKGISGDQLKSSRAKARKRENYPSVNVASREREAFSKIRSAKSLDREVTEDSRRLEETPELSVKPLRSIEDIRKSIDNARNNLAVVKESRSAIANRHSTSSRAGIDTKGSVSATDAARNVFSAGDPIILTKIKSCVSRTTKSPSPDAAARKQHETNATRTTRGNVLSSPSKSPDIASRRVPTDSKNQETKPSRKSTVAKDVDSIGSKAATIAAVDVADGVVLQNGSPHEESPTKKSDAFVTDLDDQPSKESDTVSPRKPPVRKSPSDQQTTSRGSGRPISSSSSSANSSQSQTSSTKARMATKTSSSSGPQTKKTLPAKSSGSNTDNLVPCSICKRNFAPDRVSYHETICTKTTSKKRKQFNTKIIRARGTELEPFAKEGFDKKQESRTKKSEVKSDWRRKHEEFINTIRYAKQVQAHVATGGNPNDITPPPPSDTSDYIQCPHCGRKFNQGAAERHIPKCKNMRHNKPAHSRAPPRPRR